jgi:hypothetical protein
MNSLSWMIYLADVASGVGNALSFMGCVMVIGALVVAFARTFDEYGDPHITRVNVNKRHIAAGAAIFLVSMTIPAKETVYAIAASEIGERALTSPTGGKAVQALNAWLDKQMAGEPDEKK